MKERKEKLLAKAFESRDAIIDGVEVAKTVLADPKMAKTVKDVAEFMGDVFAMAYNSPKMKEMREGEEIKERKNKKRAESKKVSLPSNNN